MRGKKRGGAERGASTENKSPGGSRTLHKLKLVFAMAWRISPSYLLLLALNAIVGSGQIVVNVVLPKFLLDELLGGRDTGRLLLWGGAIVGGNLAFGLLVRLMKRVMDVKIAYMDQKMQQALGIKIMNVDYFYLEDPHYLDLKERAAFACVNQNVVFQLVQGLADCVKTLATLAGLITVILTLGPVLLIVSIGTVLLTLLLLAVLSRYTVRIHQQIIPINRKYNYYLGLGYNDTLQKDVRLYGLAPMLVGRVMQYTEEFMKEFDLFYNKRGLLKGLVNAVTILHAALTYAYLGLRVLGYGRGAAIGIGSFTMYVNASIQFTACFQSLVDTLVKTGQMLDYLDPFLELMELPEVQQEGDIPFEGEVEEIRFDHLSFAYPGSGKEILSDLSFTIHRGEKISIVGLNGAGKTTLIKLICRLYHPTAGHIFINGHDIFEYEYESYTRKLAAVFQDYKLFAFSLRENITSLDEGQEDAARLSRIIEEVGLEEKMQELPNGLGSIYGKSYDEEGVELSGGQGQKIAIARALYKDASLVILDEPTSALDPLAEADIYQNFNTMVEQKTAIYISHRMSSSVFCDRILILDGGRIAGFDSHENLMKEGDSLYCRLFRAQAENYQQMA